MARPQGNKRFKRKDKKKSPLISGKQKREHLDEMRHAKRQADVGKQREDAIRSGRLILADLSKQAPNNSYHPRREYWDVEFTCVDCGRSEVWTARQQQWWYEVAKGSIHSTAIRCREC